MHRSLPSLLPHHIQKDIYYLLQAVSSHYIINCRCQHQHHHHHHHHHHNFLSNGLFCVAEAAERAEKEARKVAEAEAEAKAEREAATAGEEQYKLGSALLADAEKLQKILAGGAFQKIFQKLRKHGYVNCLPNVYRH